MSTVVFLWDNYGPMHVDRCEAVQARIKGQWRVIGVEQFATSHEYEWEAESGNSFKKVTLFAPESRSKNALFKAKSILRALRQEKAKVVFFCNWDRPEIFLAALINRLSGKRTYVMGCSKYDDMPRNIWREILKSLIYLPYQGGISSGERSVDYLRFMGVPAKKVMCPYNTLSIDRVRKMSGTVPAPNGVRPEVRHFTIVARFVDKKNIAMALEAYALYRTSVEDPRPLHLCGSGPLESALRTQVKELCLEKAVVFRGFLQTAEIARVLGQSYALILPSIEEQFGNVVIEAQAMGLPVLLSDRCGARDHLVRTAINGFVFEPDNPLGLAFFMTTLDRDRDLWARLCRESLLSAPKGDVAAFAEAVACLIGTEHKMDPNS